MSRTNRVVVLGRGPVRAAAAAAFLQGPGVALIGDTESSDTGGGWTAMMRDLRRLEVDLTRFRPGNDPDEMPLTRHVGSDSVASADVLMADMSLAPDVVRAALYHARGKVVLEPSPEAARLSTYAPFVSALVPTPATLCALNQVPADSDPLPLAQELAQRLRVGLVVPLNPFTTLLVRRDQEPERIEAPATARRPDRSDRAVEDCFRGVLAAQLATKTPIPTAARNATHAAALWAGEALDRWPSPLDVLAPSPRI